MAFNVNTYVSERDLQTAIGGTVTTFDAEASLEAGVNAALSADYVVAKGGKFTLCDSPTLPNIVAIVAKGAEYTVIDGTP